jgi:hypothetical protein
MPTVQINTNLSGPLGLGLDGNTRYDASSVFAESAWVSGNWDEPTFFNLNRTLMPFQHLLRHIHLHRPQSIRSKGTNLPRTWGSSELRFGLYSCSPAR